MRKLTGLNARGRQISNLLGIEGAINLTELDLGKNNLQLQGLPAHVFQRMTKLTSLRLDQNRLGTNLPNGIFRGLTGLTRLWLQGNADGPGVQFEVRLETVGENGFKVVAPNGAPFDIKVGLLFNKVTAPTGSTLVTIPTGESGNRSVHYHSACRQHGRGKGDYRQCLQTTYGYGRTW